MQCITFRNILCKLSSGARSISSSIKTRRAVYLHPCISSPIKQLYGNDIEQASWHPSSKRAVIIFLLEKSAAEFCAKLEGTTSERNSLGIRGETKIKLRNTASPLGAHTVAAIGCAGATRVVKLQFSKEALEHHSGGDMVQFLRRTRAYAQKIGTVDRLKKAFLPGGGYCVWVHFCNLTMAIKVKPSCSCTYA